ncbi:hypothetical protein IT774_02535 [Salinimonas marina]|uniref:Uncharacterized protein n=1 Tax=Salinimonas marina TaxID=2785918 RepID=A0A7S9DZB1_9ALTE|nr:hypothetical protein [Salinimonas marina]QPG06115.1 hypothetical protein IT774_02535 [Salinimonas marina]
MSEVQKMLVSFHVSLVLVSIMISTLLFVFEIIPLSLIIVATLLNLLLLELGFFLKSRFLTSPEKPQPNPKTSPKIL